MDVHNFAGAGMVGGFDGVTVDGDVAFFDEALDRATRDGGKMLTQEYVEPLGGKGLFDQHLDGAWVTHAEGGWVRLDAGGLQPSAVVSAVRLAASARQVL